MAGGPLTYLASALCRSGSSWENRGQPACFLDHGALIHSTHDQENDGPPRPTARITTASQYSFLFSFNHIPVPPPIRNQNPRVISKSRGRRSYRSSGPPSGGAPWSKVTTSNDERAPSAIVLVPRRCGLYDGKLGSIPRMQFFDMRSSSGADGKVPSTPDLRQITPAAARSPGRCESPAAPRWNRLLEPPPPAPAFPPRRSADRKRRLRTARCRAGG